MTFRDTVNVQEFKRKLDGGGTVPLGCKVSLGLGRKARSSEQPLAAASAAATRRRIEEGCTFVPGVQRQRLLRRAMGDAKYFKAWLTHRREVQQILRSRTESREDGKDKFPMLCPEEARQRAMQLREEAVKLAAEVKEQAASMGKKRQRQRQVAEKRGKSLPTPGSRRVRPLAAGSTSCSSDVRPFVASSKGVDASIPPCHLCSRQVLGCTCLPL